MNDSKILGKALTASLEDYLETILQLTRDKPVARIKDIARERKVKPGSVSPAMKRLEEMGLITYGRNEYIELTAEGSTAAHKVLARHDILTNFFERFLQMSPGDAEDQACEMEHHLSDLAMDRLVRLFEFLHTCPDAPGNFLERFHHCCRLNPENGSCEAKCSDDNCKNDLIAALSSVADLDPGMSGTVRQVKAEGAVRQRLLDMGILPDVKIRMERKALSGDPVWIRVDSYQVSLRREEARKVLISKI